MDEIKYIMLVHIWALKAEVERMLVILHICSELPCVKTGVLH